MMEVRTPAKINLVLDVLARRPDGYHEISSLMIKVGLYDRLTVEPGSDGRIRLSTTHAEVPADGSNLICKAAECLAHAMGRLPGCRIHLEKAIPVGGGMGGGSSNAAGALRALNALWGAGFTDARLAELGSTLGADVPFFFATDCAIVSGKGERVRPVRLAFAGWALLIMGGVHVSTALVYARCTPGKPETAQDDLESMSAARNADALRAGLRNALEPAVFSVAPEILALRERVREAGGRELRVSGAGSVLFDIFDSREQATAFGEVLRCRGISNEMRVVRAPVAE
jgi:4-diphosphocytidyl-2-C-methyl-D-erythritol kinase